MSICPQKIDDKIDLFIEAAVHSVKEDKYCCFKSAKYYEDKFMIFVIVTDWHWCNKSCHICDMSADIGRHIYDIYIFCHSAYATASMLWRLWLVAVTWMRGTCSCIDTNYRDKNHQLYVINDKISFWLILVPKAIANELW